MPAKSQAQANLMRAAEHGADFAMARKVRSTMRMSDLHDFAVTKSANLPKHVKAKGQHPHRNLGKYIHPKGGY